MQSSVEKTLTASVKIHEKRENIMVRLQKSGVKAYQKLINDQIYIFDINLNRLIIGKHSANTSDSKLILTAVSYQLKLLLRLIFQDF